MGCVASKLEQEEEVITILRERKGFLKQAVERRYALAEAQSRYNKSLFAVSAAIKLFVARHASPTAPFLITFPESDLDQLESCLENSCLENVVSSKSNSMLLQCQQTPSEACQSAVKVKSFEQIEVDDELRIERNEHYQQVNHIHQHEQHMNGYYYMQMAPQMSVESGNGDFGWDFFNPFDGGVRPEVVLSEEDLKAVREREGIPELEEEGDSDDDDDDDDDESVDDKVVVVEENVTNERTLNVNEVEGDTAMGARKGLTVIDRPEDGRELLEALKDIEDYFLRAYNSGKEVSRMLEANRVHLHSNLEEIKENSTKLLAIAWHRSTSSGPSCQSLVTSSSKSSSSLMETKNDLLDSYEGMDSGSHSLTLERLYAWEKKLYDEVKAGDNTRKIYDKKCSQLKNHDARSDDVLATDKTRAAVKDLYARILVAIRSAESISRRIDKLRDEELLPQICELLQGLMRNWKVLLDAHETQNRILSEVKSFTCPTYGKFCTDSHRLATLQLQIELHSWRTCFMDYIAATRGYIEALYNWLAKFVSTEVEVHSSKGKPSSTPAYHLTGPPLLMTLHDWLESFKLLPNQSVSLAMKGCAKDVRALWLRQGDELQQKRKVETVAKEYEKRLHSFEKQMHNPVLAIKLNDDDHYEPEPNDNLSDKSDQLETLRRRLELEKEKHQQCIQETQHITLNGLQTGFCSVFESLIHFSQGSFKMYSKLAEPETSDEHSQSDQNSLR